MDSNLLTWEQTLEKIRKGEDFPETYSIYGARFPDSADNLSILLHLKDKGCLPTLIRVDRYFCDKMRTLGKILNNICCAISDEGVLRSQIRIPLKSMETPTLPSGKIDLEMLSQEYIDNEKLWRNYSNNSENVNLVNGEIRGDITLPISNLLGLYYLREEPIEIINAPERLRKKIRSMVLQERLMCA